MEVAVSQDHDPALQLGPQSETLSQGKKSWSQNLPWGLPSDSCALLAGENFPRAQLSPVVLLVGLWHVANYQLHLGCFYLVPTRIFN